MTDHGLKCWDSAGNLTLDITHTISRLRFTMEVGTNQSGSLVLSDIAGKAAVAWSQCVAVPPAGLSATQMQYGYHPHRVTLATVNGLLEWEPKAAGDHMLNATSNLYIAVYE